MSPVFPPNLLLHGSEFKNIKLYKILNANLKHFNYTYKEGLNELDGEFYPFGDCEAGGFYVTDNPEMWIGMGTHIASVTLPDNAKVWTGGCKYKIDGSGEYSISVSVTCNMYGCYTTKSTCVRSHSSRTFNPYFSTVMERLEILV